MCVCVCVGGGGGGSFSPPHIIVLCLKAIQTKPRNKGGIKIRQCSRKVLNYIGLHSTLARFTLFSCACMAKYNLHVLGSA